MPRKAAPVSVATAPVMTDSGAEKSTQQSDCKNCGQLVRKCGCHPPLSQYFHPDSDLHMCLPKRRGTMAEVRKGRPRKDA